MKTAAIAAAALVVGALVGAGVVSLTRGDSVASDDAACRYFRAKETPYDANVDLIVDGEPSAQTLLEAQRLTEFDASPRVEKQADLLLDAISAGDQSGIDRAARHLDALCP